MTFCSWKAGWRSLLLRAYDDPPAADAFDTSATDDHCIVLVTGGSCQIESFRNGAWHGAAYRPGHIGMIPPAEVATLRWREGEGHSTLQLHLPNGVIAAMVDELHGEGRRVALPGCLAGRDSTMAALMLSLHRAALAGAPDLYAEAGAQFLAAHLLVNHCRISAWPVSGSQIAALRQVDAYMRDHLSETISLACLAEIAGISRFQLLRAANMAWRETPILHLTRLRMERARRLLLNGRRTVAEIAVECGYAGGSHFATAFKRHVGVSPSEFRGR